MAHPSLVAAPDTIIVDADNGQTSGFTQVVYDGGGDAVEIWERPIGQPSWARLNLVALSGASTPAEAAKAIRKGNIQSRSLAPGQVLQYGLRFAHSGFNPNTPGAGEDRFEALLTIFALLKRSSEPNWITHESEVTGGTFRSRNIATGTLPTFLFMQLGQGEPFRDNLGMFRFASPEHTKLSAFAVLHKVEVTPLLPGTRYFAAIRLSDSAGRRLSSLCARSRRARGGPMSTPGGPKGGRGDVSRAG
jgi:hypothetical protein